MLNSTTIERFEILRRILDRMHEWAAAKKDGVAVDYVQHLRNELVLLREECDMKTQSTLRNAK